MGDRQRAWPTQWLMTDERIGERLWDAIGRLPASEAGIVFRHYQSVPEARLAIGQRIAQLCRSRNLALAVAGSEPLALSLGADLVHNPPEPPRALPFSMAVHSIEQASEAHRLQAALVFVSPVYATRSHPEAPPLGPEQAKEIARASGAPAIALGGLSATRFAALGSDFHGWAAIDAWLS